MSFALPPALARGRQRGALVAIARFAALATATALTAVNAHAEPPEAPGLRCTVTQQRVGEGMGLQVQFTNDGMEDLSLAPGAHLVWYRDAAAQDAMEHTVRASRVQNTALVVPAASTRAALLAVTPALLDELRCNSALPAAAALYFYQFNPRPRWRCLLQGYDTAAVALRPTCQARAASAASVASP